MSRILIVGVEVRAVDLSGSERFKPQSPLAKDDGVVSKACWVGYGKVAVSESYRWVVVTLSAGLTRGGGSENNRELRRRLPVGDSLWATIGSGSV